VGVAQASLRFLYLDGNPITHPSELLTLRAEHRAGSPDASSSDSNSCEAKTA